MQHKTDVAVGFFPRQRMINNFFSNIFLMLQTMVFYVTDVFLLCCGCYFLMLQKIYMLHTTFTHVTAEIFAARLPSDARRPDASSPFTKSNGQYMALSWPHTPPSWPCPGHIILHPDRYSSPLFSLQYGSLHLSILKHNTTGLLGSWAYLF